MVAAVKDLPPEVWQGIEYRQWSMRSLEGVERMRSLGAKSLPALAIAGRLVFECNIPSQEELIRAIRAAG